MAVQFRPTRLSMYGREGVSTCPTHLTRTESFRRLGKSSDISRSPHRELTPWSMQEIERVVKSNPAALKDAISVFGSEAAVMFAVTSAAKTGLANIVRSRHPFRIRK